MPIGTSISCSDRQLLRELRDALVEFVNTTSRVYKFHLTRKEWVTVRWNLHFYEWIIFAVFPGNSFFGSCARFTEERIVRWDVFEHNGTVTGRMNIFFHDAILLKICCKLVFRNSRRKSTKTRAFFPNIFLKKSIFSMSCKNEWTWNHESCPRICKTDLLICKQNRAQYPIFKFDLVHVFNVLCHSILATFQQTFHTSGLKITTFLNFLKFSLKFKIELKFFRNYQLSFYML